MPAPGFTQSFNRYSYVFNNPLSFTDPSGFEPTWDEKLPWLWADLLDLFGDPTDQALERIRVFDHILRNWQSIATTQNDPKQWEAYIVAHADAVVMDRAGSLPGWGSGGVTCGDGGAASMCHLGRDQWQVDPRSRIADIPLVSSIDFGLGWLTQGLWGGPVRGLLSNVEPSGRELMDAKLLVVTSASAPLTGAASGSRVIDAASVRFTQSSVRGSFSDGRTLQSTIDALSGPNGAAVASQIPPIRIFGGPNGLMYTLDNRRLLAFAAGRRPVPYRWATSDEIAAEMWKMTLTSEQLEGWFIRVKP